MRNSGQVQQTLLREMWVYALKSPRFYVSGINLKPKKGVTLVRRDTWENYTPYPEIPRYLRFDSSGLNWAELDFDVLLRFEGGDLGLTDGPARRRMLDSLEAACVGIARGFSNTIQENATDAADAPGAPEDAENLFPWLAWRDRDIRFQNVADDGFLSQALNSGEPLIGQRVGELRELVGVVKLIPRELPHHWRYLNYSEDDPHYGVPLATIQIDGISFDEGSLFAWIKGKARVLVLVGRLLVPVAGGAGIVVYDHVQLHEKIEIALKDQPMVTQRGFALRESEWRKLGEGVMNYDQPGLSAEERRYRIAILQLALKMYFHTGLIIDGQMGPVTMQHIREFARANDLPANPHNLFLQKKLYDVLLPDVWSGWIKSTAKQVSKWEWPNDKEGHSR